MTRRVSSKADPVKKAAPEKPPPGTESVADGEPVAVADEQTAAAAEPEQTEEDTRSGVPAPVAEEKESTAAAKPEPDAEMALPDLALASAPWVSVPASSMDSLTLPERSRHEAGDCRFAQPAHAVTGIQQGFDLFAIPRQKLLFLVPSQRTLGGPGLFEDDLAFVLQPGDFVRRERVREPKRDEINRALLLQMRKLPAKMQPGHQWIRRRRI